MEPFPGQHAQVGMPSLELAALDYGQIDPGLLDFVTVHLLLYGLDGKAPSLADAARWEQHYGLHEKSNHLVLVGTPQMLSSKTKSMIPGLQLVDRNFRLRYDSAGRRAPHDMWADLWPGVSGLLSERPTPRAR